MAYKPTLDGRTERRLQEIAERIGVVSRLDALRFAVMAAHTKLVTEKQDGISVIEDAKK